MDKTLLFEIFSISFLLLLGIGLQVNGLPGWGVISVAAILVVSSTALRLINAREGSWESTAAAG